MSTKGLQILDSLIPPYDETLSETSTNAVQNQAVASAVSDLNNSIDELNETVESITVVNSSTYESKTDASSKLTEAKTYTDSAISAIVAVQFITWGEDD